MPNLGVWCSMMFREDKLEFVTRGEKSKRLTDDVSEDFGRLREYDTLMFQSLLQVVFGVGFGCLNTKH